MYMPHSFPMSSRKEKEKEDNAQDYDVSKLDGTLYLIQTLKDGSHYSTEFTV